MAGQLWMTNSLGGFLANPTLSKQIRHAAQPMMKFRQFVDAEPAAGKNRDNTFLFDKISNISTAGGTLVETNTIPKNNYTITQGSLVITEYGNSIPYTLKGQTLAEVSVSDNIKTVLRNDMAKVLDSAAATQFQASDYLAVCSDTATTVFTSNSTVTITATANMSDKNARDVIDELKKNNVPRYDGQGNYICIASTNSIRGLYDFFEAKAQNTTMAPLFNGEVGRYYGCRFIEETNRLVNTIGSGSALGEAVYFGADAVKEGLVIPENIRIDIPKDFGRDQAIAWYALTGFQKTWDFTTDGETRIIYVTSA
jgi:N4-gp56 family major capsid protein